MYFFLLSYDLKHFWPQQESMRLLNTCRFQNCMFFHNLTFFSFVMCCILRECIFFLVCLGNLYVYAVIMQCTVSNQMQRFKLQPCPAPFRSPERPPVLHNTTVAEECSLHCSHRCYCGVSCTTTLSVRSLRGLFEIQVHHDFSNNL